MSRTPFPNVALALSSESVRLLHRQDGVWHLVGIVSVSDPDFDSNLVALREKAVARQAGKLRTRVILPDDQIRFMTLDSGSANLAAVRQALDGATPYALDDLAIDHVSNNGKTYIAAVARETLDEAEAFAVEHGFAPVAFAAAPESGRFSGEAFFGPTKAGPGLLAEGETIAREDRAVRVGAGILESRTPDPLPASERGSASENPAAKAAEPENRAVSSSDAAKSDAPLSDGIRDAKSEKVIAASGSATETVLEAAVAAAKNKSARAPTEALSRDDGPDAVSASGKSAAAEAARPSPTEIADQAMPPANDAKTSDAKTGVAAKSAGPIETPAEEAPFIDVADDDAEDDAGGAPVTDPAAGPMFASRLRAQRDAQPTVATQAGPRGDAEPPFSSLGGQHRLREPGRGLTFGTAPRDLDATPAARPDTAPNSNASMAEKPASETSIASRLSPAKPVPIVPAASLDFETDTPTGKAARGSADLPTGRHNGGTPVAPPAVPYAAPPVVPPASTSGPVPVPARLPPGTPPPAVAERLAAIANRKLAVPQGDVAAPVRAPLPPASKSAPHAVGRDFAALRNDEAPAAGPAVRPAFLDELLPTPGPANSGAAIEAPPSSLGDTLRQDNRASDPAPTERAAPKNGKSAGGITGLFSSRRKSAERIEPELVPQKNAPHADTRSGTAAQPMPAPTTNAEPARDERESLTVFGARAREAEKARKNRPRFMLLMLVVLLLLFMAVVAALASGSGGTVAAWLGFGQAAAPAESVAATGPAPADATIAAAPQTTPAVDPQAVAALLPETAPGAEDTVAALVAPGLEQSPGAPLAETQTAVNMAPAQPDASQPDTQPRAETEPAAPLAPQAEAPLETAAIDTAIAPAAPAVRTGTIPSPAEADRFYAATGVWLRAPRLPLLPEAETLGAVSATDMSAPATAASAPALPAAAPDGGLAPQRNPPAADITFTRDARGFIQATPQGTITPDGLPIYAGLPAIQPPTRPGTIAPPPAPAPEIVDAVGFVNALAAAPGRPALRPAAFADLFGSETVATTVLDPVTGAPRPADPALDVAGAAVPPDAPAAGNEALAGGVNLNGLRPPLRPADFAAALPEAQIAPEIAPEVTLASFTGPRPPVRPETLDIPEPTAEAVAAALADSIDETAVADAAAAAAAGIPINSVSSALAAIVAEGPDPLASATQLAVAQAPRPGIRPRNFSTVVASTQAREQAAVAAVTPAASVNAGGIPRAPEDDGEPDTASAAAAAPTGPTSTTVAAAATQESVIDLRAINLIGVYGRPNERSALIRLANGRYVRVGVGDSFEGGQITAIGDNALNYVVRGQLYALVIPSG